MVPFALSFFKKRNGNSWQFKCNLHNAFVIQMHLQNVFTVQVQQLQNVFPHLQSTLLLEAVSQHSELNLAIDWLLQRTTDVAVQV